MASPNFKNFRKATPEEVALVSRGGRTRFMDLAAFVRREGDTILAEDVSPVTVTRGLAAFGVKVKSSRTLLNERGTSVPGIVIRRIEVDENHTMQPTTGKYLKTGIDYDHVATQLRDTGQADVRCAIDKRTNNALRAAMGNRGFPAVSITVLEDDAGFRVIKMQN